MSHHTDVEAKGVLVGVGSPLSPFGLCGANSDCQAWQKEPLPTEPSYPQSYNLFQTTIVMMTTQSPPVTAFSLPSIWPCHYLVLQSFYFQLAHFSPNYLILPPSFLIVCENKPASFEPQLHYTFFFFLSSLTFFLFKNKYSDCWWRNLPKDQWPAYFFFFSRTAITVCQRHTSSLIYVVCHSGGVASSALLQTLLSKLDVLYTVNEAVNIKLRKWAISVDRSHLGHTECCAK